MRRFIMSCWVLCCIISLAGCQDDKKPKESLNNLHFPAMMKYSSADTKSCRFNYHETLEQPLFYGKFIQVGPPAAGSPNPAPAIDFKLAKVYTPRANQSCRQGYQFMQVDSNAPEQTRKRCVSESQLPGKLYLRPVDGKSSSKATQNAYDRMNIGVLAAKSDLPRNAVIENLNKNEMMTADKNVAMLVKLDVNQPWRILGEGVLHSHHAQILVPFPNDSSSSSSYRATADACQSVRRQLSHSLTQLMPKLTQKTSLDGVDLAIFRQPKKANVSVKLKGKSLRNHYTVSSGNPQFAHQEPKLIQSATSIYAKQFAAQNVDAQGYLAQLDIYNSGSGSIQSVNFKVSANQISVGSMSLLSEFSKASKPSGDQYPAAFINPTVRVHFDFNQQHQIKQKMKFTADIKPNPYFTSGSRNKSQHVTFTATQIGSLANTGLESPAINKLAHILAATWVKSVAVAVASGSEHKCEPKAMSKAIKNGTKKDNEEFKRVLSVYFNSDQAPLLNVGGTASLDFQMLTGDKSTEAINSANWTGYNSFKITGSSDAQYNQKAKKLRSERYSLNKKIYNLNCPSVNSKEQPELAGRMMFWGGVNETGRKCEESKQKLYKQRQQLNAKINLLLQTTKTKMSSDQTYKMGTNVFHDSLYNLFRELPFLRKGTITKAKFEEFYAQFLTDLKAKKLLQQQGDQFVFEFKASATGSVPNPIHGGYEIRINSMDAQQYLDELNTVLNKDEEKFFPKANVHDAIKRLFKFVPGVSMSAPGVKEKTL
jgi:hypothetical protein